MSATGDEESGAPGALWAMAFLNVDHARGLGILQNALIDIEKQPVDFQRAVLSTAYTMYSDEAAETLVALLERIATPREFAIATYAVLKARDAPETRALLSERSDGGRVRTRYRNEPCYPGTPSAGCLVAMEYWSKSDGRLMHSDQLALAQAFTAEWRHAAACAQPVSNISKRSMESPTMSLLAEA